MVLVSGSSTVTFSISISAICLAIRFRPGVRPEPPSLSWNGVAGDVAGSHGADRIEGVRAAGGAGRKGVVFQVRLKVGRAWKGGGRFAVFQSPLFFGGLNAAQLIDAGVGLHLSL